MPDEDRNAVFRDSLEWKVWADITALAEGGTRWPYLESEFICDGIEAIERCGHVVCASCGEEDELEHRKVGI